METTKKHLPDNFGMKAGAEDFPLMAVIGLSYICNAKCPNCPYTITTLRKSYSDSLLMEEALFKKIADECGKYSAFVRISGGGEPMLHPKAVELIQYAKKVEAKVGLITNGSRFTEDSLRSLISVNVDVIEFSIDAGDAATYAKVRPGLLWENTLNNVNLAVEMRNNTGSKTKVIVSVINQKGVDVDQAVMFWGKKVDNVQVRKFLTWGYNEDHSGDPTPYLDPAERIPCPWLFERINIDSRGDVTICGEDIAFKYKFGNVNNVSIKELWHSSEMKSIRDLHLSRQGDKHPACKLCPDWKYRSWEYNYWNLINKKGQEKK